MRPNHVIVLIVLLVPVFAFIVYRVVIHAAFVFYHNLAVNNMMLETRKAEEAIDAQEAEPANVQPDNSGQTNPSQPANGPPGNGNGNAHGNGHVNANGNGQLANGHPPANGAGGGGGAAPPTAINGHP
ncbi:hypothetical protein BDDG_11633 [Blastomyces dermatitidis ATCC 18188]|uniref:Uncharacterized protein n=1 Tax=Ajellomyces dermatitidis (strain ATCC 18188 / CBS 674.68) TaxID=653446 RepID=A0A0J9HCA9_AJEDA|nr:hypothetical protein BDDG_11633 [Blastomyces dermatitidis ATCC 18188]